MRACMARCQKRHQSYNVSKDVDACSKYIISVYLTNGWNFRTNYCKQEWKFMAAWFCCCSSLIMIIIFHGEYCRHPLHWCTKRRMRWSTACHRRRRLCRSGQAWEPWGARKNLIGLCSGIHMLIIICSRNYWFEFVSISSSFFHSLCSWCSCWWMLLGWNVR